MKKKYVLVLNPNYNGRVALFMYKTTDPRLKTDPKLEVVEEGDYAKKIFTGVSGMRCQIFSDWSARYEG